jgi:hypothetical protein
MTKLQKLIKRLPDEQIKKMFADASEFQNLLLGIEYRRAKHVADKNRQFVAEGEEQNDFLKKREELSQLNLEIPGWEKLLNDVSSDESLKETYSHNLYVKTRRRKKLQEELKGTTPMDFLDDLIKFANDEEAIEVYDGLADHFGAWFERGNLGPGSATYLNKTYTFEG